MIAYEKIFNCALDKKFSLNFKKIPTDNRQNYLLKGVLCLSYDHDIDKIRSYFNKSCNKSQNNQNKTTLLKAARSSFLINRRHRRFSRFDSFEFFLK